MTPEMWKAVLVQGGALGVLAILGTIGVALYRIYMNRKSNPKPGPEEWSDAEVSGVIARGQLPQTVAGCERQVGEIKQQLSDSWTKTSEEIRQMREGLSTKVGALHAKMDGMKQDMADLHLEMKNGIHKAKDETRRESEDRLDRHEQKFKHELK